MIKSIDQQLFRWINTGWSHPWLDAVMPLISWNVFFLPVLLITIYWVWTRQALRGKVGVVLLLLSLAFSDGAVINPLRKHLQRPRPYLEMSDTKTLGGRTSSSSFPSSHTANWFAASVVVAVFWRRAALGVLCIAVLVGFSRVYNGMHYPSDVLGGAMLGASAAGFALWVLNEIWRQCGSRLFPDLFLRLPSLLKPPLTLPGKNVLQNSSAPWSDALISRFVYILLALVMIVRWAYLASGRIELSEDEAYQWLWSKHLDWSYYSKPPMIACAQWLGTSLFGDTELGVRFLAPLISTALGLMIFRFLRAEVNARAGLWVILATLSMPLLGVGSILLTIDPLSVFFWTLAMFSGWRIVSKPRVSFGPWVGLGLGLGGGFLSKYTALFQLVCFGLFIFFNPQLGKRLVSRNLWIPILLLVLSTLPVLYWNSKHNWITVTHLHARAGLNEAWQPTLKFFGDFVGAELGLLNPVFLTMMCIAGWRVWKARRVQGLGFYLFCMGMPLFLGYWLYSFRSRVQPNWIAPAVVPMLCLGAMYWEARWGDMGNRSRKLIWSGFSFGLLCVVLLHETRMVAKLTATPLPEKLDPLSRVRGWKDVSKMVEEEKVKLEAEGKPVVVIGGHYGITSLVTFYTPDAKARAVSDPIVFYPVGDKPVNQFYFWKRYRDRAGINAIFVQRVKQAEEAPAVIIEQFENVVDLGVREAKHRGQTVKRIQLFACRGLKP